MFNTGIGSQVYNAISEQSYLKFTDLHKVVFVYFMPKTLGLMNIIRNLMLTWVNTDKTLKYAHNP